MCPKTFHSRHTAHGIKYEPVAIDRYHKYMHSQKTPVHVFKSGFVVCTNSPILGCSPDGGKVIDPNCEDPFGLLEVKCPETKFQVSPLDACSDSKFFCERVGNMCKLKRTHAYYAQVQGQMGCTGAQCCDFVVHTKKGMSIQWKNLLWQRFLGWASGEVLAILFHTFHWVCCSWICTIKCRSCRALLFYNSIIISAYLTMIW